MGETAFSASTVAGFTPRTKSTNEFKAAKIFMGEQEEDSRVRLIW